MSAEIGYQTWPHGPDDDDTVGSIYESFRADPAKVAEADEWNDGMQDGGHYTALEIALADLGEVPTDRLIGSDALASVLRLAKVHAKAREDRLWEMAEAAAEREAA